MCGVKKPVRWTIRRRICCMETLNKYLGMLPTIKNSPMTVTSMELGNVPFTEATHVSIILSHLPVVWRNHYDLMHKTVPESPRALLLDLKNKNARWEIQWENQGQQGQGSNSRGWASCAQETGKWGKVPINSPRKAVLSNIANGAKQQTDHLRPMILHSVTGSRRTSAPTPRTGWLSPSIP